MGEMTVAVLNLNKAVDRWGERGVLVARELAHLQPDIVGFQEVDLRIDRGTGFANGSMPYASTTPQLTTPLTKRSGKQRVGHFRFACDKALRSVVDHIAFLSLRSSEWARAYYDQQRARGHSHHQALRALGRNG